MRPPSRPWRTRIPAMSPCAGEAVMHKLERQGPVLESVVSMMERVRRDGGEARVRPGVESVFDVMGLVARARVGSAIRGACP